MDYALQPHLYRNVPVYLWPWVWWQLFQIERWIKATGRMVLGGVARDGKVYVLHVADDPNDPKPWSPKDLRPLKARHQDWITALRSPCGTYDPTRYGDQLALAMRLLEWPLLDAPVGCNEPLRIAPPERAQPPPILKTPISPGLIRGLSNTRTGLAGPDPGSSPGRSEFNKQPHTHRTPPRDPAARADAQP